MGAGGDAERVEGEAGAVLEAEGAVVGVEVIDEPLVEGHGEGGERAVDDLELLDASGELPRGAHALEGGRGSDQVHLEEGEGG